MYTHKYIQYFFCLNEKKRKEKEKYKLKEVVLTVHNVLNRKMERKNINSTI